MRHGRAWAYLVTNGTQLRNFGDELSSFVVQELTARSVRWVPMRKAELIAVGSLLTSAERTNYKGRVFGSGLRDPARDFSGLASSQFLAVRGKLTRELLGVADDLPIGDPGLIVSAMWPRKAAQSNGLFVPHFALPQSRWGRSMIAAAQAAGLRIALPSLDAREMAREIRSSSVVITNSLHAHIFAHSYGVPSQLVTVTANPEPAFKYEDYLSVFGLPTSTIPISEAIHMLPTVLIDSLSEKTAIVESKISTIVENIYIAGRDL